MNLTVREKQLVALALAVGLSVGMWVGLWTVPTKALTVPLEPSQVADAPPNPSYYPVSTAYFLGPFAVLGIAGWWIWWIDPDLGPDPEGAE